jgi:5-methyltetrahydrofolate--homocysteine methyltransferase
MFDIEILKKRLLILDGAMGTCIAEYKTQGLNDMLNITDSGIITAIHRAYLAAGADIIETNTLNSNTISLADYGLESRCYDINLAGAKLARKVADEYGKFVAGSIGPTSKSLTLSPFECSFDELYAAYIPQINALIDGGADMFIVETAFDTLNVKTALVAINDICRARQTNIPTILSLTIGDFSGRILSGQTLKAFYYTFEAFDLLAIGMNCSMGAVQMLPYIKQLSAISRFPICIYPNAGLPNSEGDYHQTPLEFTEAAEEMFANNLVNIIGGCCGTTPKHIESLAKRAKMFAPRQIPLLHEESIFTGLEVVNVDKSKTSLIKIGERTNVSGSRKFARLIKEKKYDEAVVVAVTQIEQGADLIDICMDDGMIDAVSEMSTFLKIISQEPDIAKVPLMIDSSNWDVIAAALKCIGGKAIINSISLKDGEADFISKANYIGRFGAAVVVMLFDEKGQAATFARKIEIAQRAYRILIENGFEAKNIIFDPNILTIATGIEEHNEYAESFISACRWIKQNLPCCKVSGGVSNLSFSFRGNDFIRNTIHSVFLHHAKKAGMDMAIVNPSSEINYEEIEPKLREIIEDLIFNRDADAVNNLLSYSTDSTAKAETVSEIQNLSSAENLHRSLLKGSTDNLNVYLTAELETNRTAIDIIEKTLMPSMFEVGNLFAEGKMFLPQILKSASVLNKAVAFLEPHIQNNESSKSNVKILLATVKGDVHDIGKNIVSVILSANGYQVIDLGVMVEADRIINTAREEDVAFVGLSGLISPSLKEMQNTLSEAQKSNLSIPFLVGGAAVSAEYAQKHLAPVYDAGVHYIKDASAVSKAIDEILNNRNSGKKTVNISINNINDINIINNINKKNCRNAVKTPSIKPEKLGVVSGETLLEALIPNINWKILYNTWLSAKNATAQRELKADAEAMLNKWLENRAVTPRYAVGFFEAASFEDEIIIYENGAELLRLNTARDNGEKTLAMLICRQEADVKDYVGCFAATAGVEIEKIVADLKQSGDIYNSILAQSLGDCLAEALSEYLHATLLKELWRFPKKGIRPAVGYPLYPLHSEKAKIFKLLEAEKIGISLTENYAMKPAASVCGLYLANADSYLF